MLAHKRYVTIPPSGSLVLEDLPLRPGQRVEVVLISDEEERQALAAQFRALLTQFLRLLDCQVLAPQLTVGEAKDNVS